MEFDLSAGFAVLERTPQTLRAMLSGLPPLWTDATEGAETWSPYDVLGHLIEAEIAVWIPRAKILLDQGPQRRFPSFDRHSHLHNKSQGKSLADLLDEFSHVRSETLTTLRGWNLTDAQLALVGEHPDLGPVTLRQLLATWVAHDLGHIAQIVRVMAKQYREAVGPWREYLAILDR